MSNATPWDGLDLMNADAVIDVFNRAAEAQLNCSKRTGSVVDLPRGEGQLLLAGDLHDNSVNFQRLIKLADLDAHPEHHMILQEVVHSERRINGRDMSVRMLCRIAALKAKYPEQVHLIMGNHEIAQIMGGGVEKGGFDSVEVFNEGVAFIFDDRYDDVLNAMNDFLRSFLLGVRTQTGVFCSHSLPSSSRLDSFDTSVIDRRPTDDDLDTGGAARTLAWGRSLSDDVAEVLGKAWKASLFIIGHQPADMGYDVYGERILVINSEHTHGVAIPMPLDRRPSMDELIEALVPLASVVVDA